MSLPAPKYIYKWPGSTGGVLESLAITNLKKKGSSEKHERKSILVSATSVTTQERHTYKVYVLRR